MPLTLVWSLLTMFMKGRGTLHPLIIYNNVLMENKIFEMMIRS